ncbi:Uncharacterized protein Rs2_05112 [Raphanus sativus]|nr:Uncharacterized protein Rs2_05112 [Raphanus sativus]
MPKETPRTNHCSSSPYLSEDNNGESSDTTTQTRSRKIVCLGNRFCTAGGKEEFDRASLLIVIRKRYLVYIRYNDCMYSISLTAFSFSSPYRFPGGGTDQSVSSSKVIHALKMEPLNVSDLNQFIITGALRSLSFSLW